MGSGSSPADSRWFVVGDQLLNNLGQAELLQSGLNNQEFKASLVLNSYESNCLRDWLALRWKANSLDNSQVSITPQSRLRISRHFKADELQAARVTFGAWLLQVASDREKALQCRE